MKERCNYLHGRDTGFHASVYAVSGGTGELTAKEVEILVRNNQYQDFPVAQWLRLCASNTGDLGSIPGEGTKSPHALWCGKKLREKKNLLLKKKRIFACNRVGQDLATK